MHDVGVAVLLTHFHFRLSDKVRQQSFQACILLHLCNHHIADWSCTSRVFANHVMYTLEAHKYDIWHQTSGFLQQQSSCNLYRQVFLTPLANSELCLGIPLMYFKITPEMCSSWEIGRAKPSMGLRPFLETLRVCNIVTSLSRLI